MYIIKKTKNKKEYNKKWNYIKKHYHNSHIQLKKNNLPR